jgi:fused signal recognition particle receptor
MSLLKSLFSGDQEKNLQKGLEATRKSFFSKLGTAIAGKSKVDVDLLDDLEEVLVTADVGVSTTLKIIEAIEARVARDSYLGTKELRSILKEEISSILIDQQPKTSFSFSDSYQNQPHVVMVVGVNGVGKTTTIGKLAHHFKDAGKKGCFRSC